ncbi:MAG: M10 family metallopeptidase C-terminal domain-containing protein [Sphingomonas sp.]|nr:M10 family metallopeptidase C-terminal domain-containing protein [Sphingomonas sp.]
MAKAQCGCCSTAVCQNVDPVGNQIDPRGRDGQPILVPIDGPTNASANAFLPIVEPVPFVDTVLGSTATTATIAIGSGVDVVIDTLGDHDWYRVTLTAGTLYTFRTTGTGTAADSFLNLRDASGTVLTSDDDGGGGTLSLIGYTPAASGTYYIDAATYNDASAATYHLSVAATPAAGADVIAATTATTGTIAVGGAVNVRIDTSGDRDWYALTLTAGQTYLFRTGTTSVAATGDVADTTLTLRDSGGAQLAFSDDDGGLYSAIRFTATTTGTYYLDVAAFGSATGTTNLRVQLSSPLTVYTNDQIANQLTDGYWVGAAGRHAFNVAPGGTLTFNVTGLTAAGQTLAREAFNLWTDVTGIRFSEVTTTAQITLDDNQANAFANATYSNGVTTSATVNISTQWLTTYGTGLNSYSFQTYIHEIGHTLGLGHGGNYNGDAAYAADALYSNDSWATTIMSYFDQNENSYFAGLGFTRQFAVTPMIADAIATTVLYGANTLTRTGNTIYGFNNTSGRAVYDATVNPNVSYTIYDNGGIDTLDYSGFSQTQTINLNAETFSSVGGRAGNVSIARGSVIENAVGGSGNDTIIGNDVANSFDLSRGGVDTVSGGGGDDAFFFGATLTGADTIDGGAGSNDQVGIQGNYTGANALVLSATSLTGVEVLSALAGFSYDITTNNANVAAGQVLTIFGTNLGAADNLTVNASAETDGSVRVYGGLGVDTFTGGAGNDGFYFGPGRFGASDRVTGGGGSNDQIALDGDYTITLDTRFDAEVVVLLRNSSGPENNFNITVGDSFVPTGQTRTIFALSVTNPVTINGAGETDGILRIFGGTAGDTITGGSGADYIFGGNGGDTLNGGAGADIFFYDDSVQSSSTNYDRLLDFNFASDRIQISGQVHDSYATIASGALSTASFDADLNAATGAQLIGGRAVLFTPTSGTLAGQAFLVVDANGVDGYQAGADYVFQLPNAVTGGADFIIG